MYTIMIIIAVVLIIGPMKLKPVSKEYKTCESFHDHVTNNKNEVL